MTVHSMPCDRDRLQQLLEDRLAEGEEVAIAGHLEGCDSCRQVMEELAAESPWWSEARQLAREGMPTSGPESSHFSGDWLGFLDPPDGPGQIGRLGPYEVVEVIGRGGMGVVLKAFDRPLGRFVAIKVLAPELATSATARRRFAREAKAVAAIAHEHIVPIHAVDATPKGLPFLVMLLVSGRSLQERLDRTGALEVREVLRIGMQAASGLAAAHAVGLVHRDVKPANILLENGVERVKLTDFGLARAADDASLTQSGVVSGTPQYMSPEQARGEPVDARADLFSLGSVLYALCTGRPPFRAETTMGVLRRVCDDNPRPIREIHPEVPDWLQAIVAKLQAKDPADRFGSAAEVAELLGRCLAYLENPGKVPPFRAERTASRRPARALAIAAAVLLTVCVGLGASEASGVTRLSDYVATVLRIKTAQGTLVLQIDDPEVKVRVDGQDVVLTGAGPQEIRLSLKAGRHRVEKAKGGKVREDFVSIARGGKETVKVTFEPDSDTPAPAPLATIPAPEDGLRERIKALEEENRRIETDRHRLMVEGIRRWREKTERERAAGVLGLLPRAPVPPIPTRVDAIKTAAAVYSVRVSPDGKTLAVGCFDGLIRLYDPASGQPKGELRGHEMEVRAVTFSPDGKTLASAGGDYRRHEQPGELKLWDLASGRVMHDLKGHTAMVWSVAFSPDGVTLASGSWDNSARLWDARSGRLRAVLEGHRDAVRFVVFSPVRRREPLGDGPDFEGPTLATAGFDGEVRFWYDAPGRVEDGKLQKILTVAGVTGLSCIAFSPDGKTLAVSPRPLEGGPDDVILIDPATGQERARLKGHPHAVLSLAFSPDGKTLASGGGIYAGSGHDGEVILWDVASHRCKEQYGGLTYWVESVAFTPDGRFLSSGGGIIDEGGEVRTWMTSPPSPARH